MTKYELKDIINECIDDMLDEANAYDRYIDNGYKKVKNYEAKADIYNSLGAKDKADEYSSKAYKLDRKNDFKSNYNNKELAKHSRDDDDGSYIMGAFDAANNHRVEKKNWMHRNGNSGTRPEDKYKANRYLDAQEKLRKLKEDAIYEAMDILENM